MLSSQQFQKYSRQICLGEIGTGGQEKLLEAKVLMIGAGGLGCPALVYLAAAGVGAIGIVDFDTVEVSNLHRQILYNTDDVGKPKAVCAAAKLLALNPDTRTIVYPFALDNENALDIIAEYDIIIDGSDNFNTRYMVNDACVLANKPLIYGSVFRFEAQVGVFNLPDINGIKTTYRHLFPQPPLPETAPSCANAGVIGVLPGIIGTMQAAEAIKIITGIGAPLANKVLCYNLLYNSFYEIDVAPLDETKIKAPQSVADFKRFNYKRYCNGASQAKGAKEISIEEFEKFRESEDLLIIDVRERDEQPSVDEFEHLKFPLSELGNKMPEVNEGSAIVLFCQSGKRSLKAAEMMKEKLAGCNIYSLKGGIVAWKEVIQSLS